MGQPEVCISGTIWDLGTRRAVMSCQAVMLFLMS